MGGGELQKSKSLFLHNSRPVRIFLFFSILSVGGWKKKSPLVSYIVHGRPIPRRFGYARFHAENSITSVGHIVAGLCAKTRPETGDRPRRPITIRWRGTDANGNDVSGKSKTSTTGGSITTPRANISSQDLFDPVRSWAIRIQVAGPPIDRRTYPLST